jgi:hypothetical protein
VRSSLDQRRERSTQAPRAPLSANAVRNSLPRPRAAPVTTQVLPSRENAGRVIRVRRGVAVLRTRLRSKIRRVSDRVDIFENTIVMSELRIKK